MSNQAQDAVNKITETKLSEYGVKQKEERVTATNYQPAPAKTKTKTYTPKPTTSAQEWRKRFPNTSAVSVSRTLREQIQAVRGIPHLNTVDAVYTQAEWDKATDAVKRGVQDILAAAGFVCKTNADQQRFFAAMFAGLPECFKHEDDSGRYRQIVLDESQAELDLSIPDFLRRD